MSQEQRNKRISIRPNGRIRPIPVGSSAEISLNDIKQGNTMVNFQDEYDYGRYYLAKDIDKLLKSQYPNNPHTRQTIHRPQLETYMASIEGDMTGAHVPPSFNTLYPPPPAPAPAPASLPVVSTTVDIVFKLLTGRNYTATFNNNDSISTLVKKFSELTNIPEMNTYIQFVGIPTRSRDTFLVYPFLAFKSGYRNITKNLSNQLSDFNPHNESQMILFVVSRMSYYGVLGIYPDPPERYQQLYDLHDLFYLRNNSNMNEQAWRADLKEKWINIRNEITDYLINKFKNWLSENPNVYMMYKFSQFSPQLLNYVDSLEQEANKLIEEKVDAILQEYIQLPSPQQQQPRLRRNRKTRRARKNRRS